jgi:hypothetical protein
MMNQMISMVGPIAHVGSGMRTGMGMEEGMGMMRQGSALSEEHGPGMGRGMGMTTREKPVSAMVGMDMGQQHKPQSSMPTIGIMKEKKRVPGFPQDMWMPMDEAVVKPETFGLAEGWSGAVTGMMTLVRVLPPDMYEKVVSLMWEP